MENDKKKWVPIGIGLAGVSFLSLKLFQFFSKPSSSPQKSKKKQEILKILKESTQEFKKDCELLNQKVQEMVSLQLSKEMEWNKLKESLEKEKEGFLEKEKEKEKERTIQQSRQSIDVLERKLLNEVEK